MSSISPLTATEMREKIYGKQPVFAQVMRDHGQETLHGYVQQLFGIAESKEDERRTQVIAVIEHLVDERLGSTLATQVKNQLAAFPLISTTDHHSWLQDPFWLNADLFQALGIVENKKPQGAPRHVVVLSFSSVSLNNKDGFAKGTLVHESRGARLLRLPFFTDRSKHAVVYKAVPVSERDLRHWLGSVHDARSLSYLSPDDAALLEQKVVQSFNADILGASSLASQITKYNKQLWHELFKTHEQFPELIYIEIESVVSRVLTAHHLSNPESLVTQLLFDKKLGELARNAFNGIRGGFSITDRKGSYYFWAIDHNAHRHPVFLESGWLVDAQGNKVCAWHPEAVADKVQNGELMPTMLLCYLVVALYYGFTCLGGFCQVQDLTALQEALMRVLNAVGHSTEETRVRAVHTQAFLGDASVIEREVEGVTVPATSWDMMLYNIPTDPHVYLSKIKNVTLNEAVTPLIPEMYTVLFGKH